jgi:hypothetical protein
MILYLLKSCSTKEANVMADCDNMPSGLKMTTRKGIILRDNTSIAGVIDANADADAADETNEDMEIDNYDNDNDKLDSNEISDTASGS